MFRTIRKILNGLIVLGDYAEELKKMQNQTNDLQVRVQDIQDRIYDALWQQKTIRSQRDMLFWQIYKQPEESLSDAKLRFFQSLPAAVGDARKAQCVMVALLKIIHNTCLDNKLSYWLDFGTLLGAVRHSGFIPWDDDIDIGMMRQDAMQLCKVLKNDDRFFVRNYYVNGRENGINQICQIKWNNTPFGAYAGAIDIFIYDYCQCAPSKENWKYWKEQKKRAVECSKEYPEARGNLMNLIKGDTQEVLKTAYLGYYQEVKKQLKITDEDSSTIVFGFDNLDYPYGDVHIFKKKRIFPLKKLQYEGEEFFVPNEYMDYINPVYGDIFSLPSDMLSHVHVNIDKYMPALNYLYNKYVEQEQKLNEQ